MRNQKNEGTQPDITKNGTPIHIAAPSQHKHKIKHDKTTMQSSCYAGEAYLA